LTYVTLHPKPASWSLAGIALELAAQPLRNYVLACELRPRAATQASRRPAPSKTPFHSRLSSHQLNITILPFHSANV